MIKKGVTYQLESWEVEYIIDSLKANHDGNQETDYLIDSLKLDTVYIIRD